MIYCCVGIYVGEKSSESCLLLLPIAKNFVEVLKEKVLKVSAEFSVFFRLQVPMNHGDLLVFRCALFGRGVQRQLPSIITNSLLNNLIF